MIRNIMKRYFSTAATAIPIIDLSRYLHDRPQYLTECKKLVDCLHLHSCVLVKDPRILPTHLKEFYDLLEKYFDNRAQQLYGGSRVQDVYPNYGYQTGLCPENTEYQGINQEMIELIDKLSNENKTTPFEKSKCTSWRFRWRIGERPEGDRMLDPPRCLPEDFQDFSYIMDRVANNFIQTAYTSAKMLALGLDLNENAFTDMLHGGPILLSPTATDLLRQKLGSAISPFHYDHSFLTIQGRTRYQGLNVWINNGQTRTVPVIPQGHLLIQVGSELEKLSGGFFKPSYHEVVYKTEAEEIAKQVKAKGLTPWRISSTLFSHSRFDVMLEPIEKFKSQKYADKYKTGIISYQLFEQEVNKRFKFNVQQKQQQTEKKL